MVDKFIKYSLYGLLSLLFIAYAFAGETYIDGQTNDGHIIKNNGIIVAQQPVLNFTGSGVSTANSATQGETVVTITSVPNINGTPVNITSLIVVNNATIGDNITADWFLGNGSQLTGLATYINYTDEKVDDRVSVLIQNGTSYINWTYDDGAGTLTPTISGLPTYINESTTVVNSSTINATMSGSAITPTVNSTLVSLWNGKGVSNFTADQVLNTTSNVLFNQVNITGDLYVADVFVTTIDGNSYVVGNLSVYSNNTTTGYGLYVNSTTYSVGNVTAPYFRGDGSKLTNLPTYISEATTVSNTSSINLTKSTYDISADLNISIKTLSNFYNKTDITYTNFYNKTDIDSKQYSKSFVITNTTATADGPIWRTPYNITIKAIHGVQIGATNVTGMLMECDGNGTNCVVVDSSDMIILTTNVNDDGTLSNPSIDANDYVGWNTTSVSGTNAKTIVSFEYTIP